MACSAAILPLINSFTPAALFTGTETALHMARQRTNAIRCLKYLQINAGQMCAHIRPCKLLIMLFGNAYELLSGLEKAGSHFAHGVVFQRALISHGMFPWGCFLYPSAAAI